MDSVGALEEENPLRLASVYFLAEFWGVIAEEERQTLINELRASLGLGAL